MVLVDSSAWTQLLRRQGDAAIRERLRGLVLDGRAAWCEVVRLELWRGANGPIDDEVLRGFEADLVRLEMSAAVWDHACELGRRCRRSGRPVPQSDLMIFACSVVHGVELLHRDHHFDLLRTL